MERVIGLHLTNPNSFRSFASLVDDLSLPIIRSKSNLYFFSEKVYLDFEIEDDLFVSDILINRKEKGLWIFWYDNGQKRQRVILLMEKKKVFRSSGGRMDRKVPKIIGLMERKMAFG